MKRLVVIAMILAAGLFAVETPAIAQDCDEIDGYIEDRETVQEETAAKFDEAFPEYAPGAEMTDDEQFDAYAAMTADDLTTSADIFDERVERLEDIDPPDFMEDYHDAFTKRQ